ncbi:uncharacterized protein LOC586294 isoform X4 [Strongylocentrotus purpuratus]|uniref:ZP domain-containing protein n=1 Tax=Strongylocentrotus purpuratus TaxID=7668 RepID=A0A7M7NBF5_STRPU|nr:uncharacterized protein LOC586294 isoform X3 [Strongylocentrotus purpuratus]XP_030833832.1 uncharacterized protein LOC586294 isoform X4 [Strongylocentrotus purpuratus]
MIGERRKNSLCNRLVLMLCLAWVAESGADLYPYGTGNADTALSKQNDFALRVTLDRAFPFGGKYHSTLYIGDNGVISFDEEVSAESDSARHRMIPYYYDVDGDGRIEDPDTIFAFWADVDITGDGGNVYYRVTTSTTTLNQATADVQTYFRSNVDFRAQVVIVVTWDQVSFFDQTGTSDPRNTFQAVLIHDGQESFVLLNYGSITWVVGTRMDGDPNTGLYTYTQLGIAIVGFLMGDGTIVKNFAYEQDTLRSLSADSNVDVNGVYAYKVDGSSVIDPVCKTGPGAVTGLVCGQTTIGDQTEVTVTEIDAPATEVVTAVLPSDPTTGTDDPIADPTGAARTELPTTGITLTCNDTQMIVEIPKSLLTGGMEGSNVGFNDDTNGQQCVGEEDGPIITLTTNLNACGTVMTEDDETETYTNHVSNRYDDDSGISRQYAVEIPLSCSYNRSQRVGSMKYQLTDYTIDKTLVEEGAYTFSFDIYTDNTYKKVDDTYPISIGLNKDLFFAASVDSLDGTLDLSIQSCRATPDSKYDSDPHFEFIAEGCSIDDDNTKITTLEDHRIGVEMKTIRFIDDEDDWIYIHCNLLVCDDEDDDSVCNNDCALGSSEIMGRKRRDVSSELKTKRFTRGPLRVVRSAQRQGSVLRNDVSENGASTQQEVTNAFNPWIVAMAAMATGFMAMAAMMAVVLRKFSKISAAPAGYKEGSARLLDEQEEI